MRLMCGVVVIACMVVVAVGGCGTVSALTEAGGVLPASSSFIMSGEAKALEAPYPFPFWQGLGGGQMFVLFQTTAITNDDFNAITTPGTQSRLQLSVRNDLFPLVQSSAIPVDVVQILEVNGVDTQ